MHTTTFIYGAIALAASVNARAVLDQSFAKRHAFGSPEGTCAVQLAGSGPSTTPDDADHFLSNPVLSQSASSANTPAGYTLQYSNQQWASTSSGYLGVEEISSYDVDYCAKQCCSATSWAGCKSFNIFYERNPTLDPGPGCMNPPSTNRIKCSYWTGIVSTADEHNDGQYCGGFHVVITGSNGYKVDKCPAPSSTTTAPAVPTTTTKSVAVTTPSTTAVVTTTTSIAPGPSGVCLCSDGKAPSTFYTASNGDKYGICKDTDFYGGDFPNQSGTIYSITSDQACADACSATAGCVSATLHLDASVCYLKSSFPSASYKPGEDSVCKIAPGPGTSSTTTTTKSVTTKSATTTSSSTTMKTTTKSVTTASSTTTSKAVPTTTPSTTKAVPTTTPSTTKAIPTTTPSTTKSVPTTTPSTTKSVPTTKSTTTPCTTDKTKPTPPPPGPTPPPPGPNPPPPGPTPPSPGPNPGPGPNPPPPPPKDDKPPPKDDKPKDDKPKDDKPKDDKPKDKHWDDWE